MSIELENAMSEAIEIARECIRCGLCRELCPVLRIRRDEIISPRGKAILLDNSNFEKIVYDCTLCKACETKCPKEIKLCDAFIKAREVLVLQGKGLSVNKEMIENLEKTGNVFGY
ncbi:(Fe-S)-binding protein [Candidatus Pacearchaeota archaeon]|nr:(Fe-S)-binding protein [Candidatus Pacearchaeota archaeon]